MPNMEVMQVKVFLFVYSIAVTVQSNENCGVLKDVSNVPWTVGLYAESKGNKLELVCIGSAIKPGFVVTAAHCLCDAATGQVKSNNFYIASGELDKILSENDKGHLQKVERQKIFVNRNFKGVSTGHKGDIAIVRLENQLNHDGFMPICTDWDNTTPNLANEYKLRQSTWQRGKIKITDVSYVDPELCRSAASPSFVTFVTSDKICAKSDRDVSTENIDGGGGLMYLDIVHNTWYIRGVVSGHDDKQKLVLYSNINIFLNWVSGICATP